MCFKKPWTEMTVCAVSRLLPNPYCPSTIRQKFRRGNEPKTQCAYHKEPVQPVIVRVCTTSGLPPNQWCPATEEREFLPDAVPTETCAVHKEPTVWREVCAVTGLLVNPYCRGIFREFPQGQEPTTICLDHGKSAPNDKCLLGFGPLGLIGDGALCVGKDYITRQNGIWTIDEAGLFTYFKAVSDAGANLVRLFAWGVFGNRASKADQFQCFEMEGDKWNLDRFNGYYFPIIKWLIKIANLNGLAVLFDWLDQCEIQGGPWRVYSPWANNTQGGYDFYDSAIWPQVRTFMGRCVDEFAGLDVLWGFNETHHPDFRPFANAVYFPLVIEKGLDYNRLTNGAEAKMPAYVNGAYDWSTGAEPAWPLPDIQHWVRADWEEVAGEYNVLCILREVHGCRDRARPGYFDAYMEAWRRGGNPIRILVDDDGVFDGDSDEDYVISPSGQRQARPSAATWKAMVKEALSYLLNVWQPGGMVNKCSNFSHSTKSTSLDVQLKTIRAMSEGYKEALGAWPGNWRD